MKNLTTLVRIRIRIYSDPVRIPELDPDPYEHENQDPDTDPNRVGSDPPH